MKARHAILVALVAAISMTSVAAAGPGAAKQRVAINMKIYPRTRSCSCRCRPDRWRPTQARSAATGRASPDAK